MLQISELHSGGNNTRITYNDKVYVVIKEQLGYLDAELITLVFVDVINEWTKSDLNRIIYLTISVIFVLIIVTDLIVKMILKKLEVVVSSMRKVQDGELDIEIPVYG